MRGHSMMKRTALVLVAILIASAAIAATPQPDADCAAALAQAKDSDEYIKTLLHFVWKASADELDAKD